MRFLVTLLGITVALAAPKERPVVEVFTPPVLDSELEMAFAAARNTATKIYSDVGIRVIWRPGFSRSAGCSQQQLNRKILVAFAWTTPRGMSADVMAYSNVNRVDGPCVTLLMHRLVPMIRVNPTSSSIFLGHVLAHEMGHILQGVERHSEVGVMKSRWSAGDILEMTRNRLHFTAYDTDLLLDGVGASRAVFASNLQAAENHPGPRQNPPPRIGVISQDQASASYAPAVSQVGGNGGRN